MIAWPSGVVRVMKQSICGVVIRGVKYENGSGSESPDCRSRPVQSIVRPSSRAGVPVFKRPRRKPAASRLSLSRLLGRSPKRPAGTRSSPMWIMPRKNVPVVRITAPHKNSARPVFNPDMRPSQIVNSVTSSSTMERLGHVWSACCMASRYNSRSACARGPRTAAPLERLSMRN